MLDIYKMDTASAIELTSDINHKVALAKYLNEGDWQSVHKYLGANPIVLRLPKMVDGQAAPDSAAARAEQTIVATAMSDEMTIFQVLRHYGITPTSLTLRDVNLFNPKLEIDLKQLTAETVAKTGYKGEIKWDSVK